MNGVRRFLGGGGSNIHPPLQPQPPPPTSIPDTPPPPPPASSKPPWTSPPNTPTEVKSHNGTPGLVIRKDRSQPPLMASPANGSASVQSPTLVSTPASVCSPTGSIASKNVTSPTRKPVPSGVATVLGSPTPASSRAPPTSLGEPTTSEGSVGRKRTSGLFDVRNELLMSLLTSEAVVDSRECEILSAEEVEELKKEHHILMIRQTAMQKKLALETKIRDAALSLSKVNAAHKKVSKQTEEQLETAERKVSTAQKELWRVSERTGEVYRKLLEHRAGVLGYSVHSMEKKLLPSLNGASVKSGASLAPTPNRSSTVSSATSVMSTPSKFDGAHLFAGHADAQIPKAPLSATSIATLEANVRAATDSLNEANKKNAALARELSHLRLEKEQMETEMSMELQNAEETVAALEQELPRLEEIRARCDELTKERVQWEEGKQKLAVREREVEMLERRLEVLEERSGEATEMERTLASIREKAAADLQSKDEAFSTLRVEHEEARANWQAEKAVMEGELDRLRGGGEAKVELEGAFETLRKLMQLHNVDHASRDASLQGLLASIEAHLEKLSAVLNEQRDSRVQLESRHQAELDASRRERDDTMRETLVLEARVKELTSSSIYSGPPIEYKGEVADVVALLQPLWAVLPAPELRSAKLTTPRHLRGASTASSPGTLSKSGLPSLSDMDVRALKALYDPKSPQTAVGGAFSLETFVARVQALVIDDRALIERLIRSAQAHDLLKRNAERAQKLAEDTNAALETYQKHVATLDDQNFALQKKQANLMNEIQDLQVAADRALAEKRDIEMQAADQAETCQQLTEANNMLSGKTLALAQEAASASEKVRKQLEGQLDECQKALRGARGDVEAMRTSEQTQRVALMDELTLMQTENANLKAQLRSIKK